MDKHMKNSKLLYFLISGVLAAWISTFFLVYFYLPDWTSRGQFGDLFGSINSLFSGLAFAGLFYTISLQQRQISYQVEELELQRKELELQRKEMQASRQELANQSKMQLALFKANAAQIRVAAINAEIESIKVKASAQHEFSRSAYADDISGAATTLKELAIQIESAI